MLVKCGIPALMGRELLQSCPQQFIPKPKAKRLTLPGTTDFQSDWPVPVVGL